MAVCLLLVCLVCSALLGGVYVLTLDKINEEVVKKTNNAIALVTPEFDNEPSAESLSVELDGDAVTVYPAKKGGQTVGYAVESFTSKGFSGTINIMVGPRSGSQDDRACLRVTVCRQEPFILQTQRHQGRRRRGCHYRLHDYLQSLLRCRGQGIQGVP